MFGEGGVFWVAGRVLGVQAGVCFVAFRCWLIFSGLGPNWADLSAECMYRRMWETFVGLGAAEMEVGEERSGFLRDFGGS